MREWAIASHGIIVRSEWSVADDFREGRLVRLLADYRLPSADIVAFVGPRHGRLARTSRFLRYLKDGLILIDQAKFGEALRQVRASNFDLPVALERHSPLEQALLDEWAEGLGTYYSLSSSWRATGLVPSSQTANALAEPEPRFVARMTALACADSAAARPLLAGLSNGPFTEKWGALPVALWLLAGHANRADALRDFAQGGPTAVWALSQRHLPPVLADSLEAARTRAAHCPASAP